MDCEKIVYREHAIKRMFSRKISPDMVAQILATGEVIRSYDDDKPFSSFLFLGYDGDRPIHVVASKDNSTCYIITVYVPDPEIWQNDFKTKKT